ncbi:alkaline phosphatase [Exiguobacterium sp. SL14]|nr:alkaline phosphatase [Exiguobacterium sp. SL14]MCY1692496.1 alkaline phosphatase [Exiguobacterium sp. SL14]
MKNVKATGDEMVRQFNDDLSNIASVVKRETTFDLTAEEIQTLQKVDAKKRVMTLNEMISKRAYVGWTTSVHTGVDVPLYAYGPQSEQFGGLHENTDIPGLMANAMKLKK